MDGPKDPLNHDVKIVSRDRRLYADHSVTRLSTWWILDAEYDWHCDITIITAWVRLGSDVLGAGVARDERTWDACMLIVDHDFVDVSFEMLDRVGDIIDTDIQKGWAVRNDMTSGRRHGLVSLKIVEVMRRRVGGWKIGVCSVEVVKKVEDVCGEEKGQG